MQVNSLRSIIDDILLIVRNNNISESEDLSRAQIANWVIAYAELIRKQDDDKNLSADEDWFDETYVKEAGPLELEKVQSNDDTNLHTRITKESLDVYNDTPANIIAVYDQQNCPIQFMHGIRRHFHYARKYTNKELTYDWSNNDHKILIQGTMDDDKFKYIYVKYIAKLDADVDEDEAFFPAWMTEPIKEQILKNELAFMLKMPSDDTNNSTLDGIKPHGPKEDQK